MIRSIDHLNIVVSNLDEAVTFFELLEFRKTFGAPLDPDFLGRVTGLYGVSGQFAALSHPGSSTVLELLQFDQPVQDLNLNRADRIGLRHLALSVSDIAGEVERLQQAGIVFLSPVQTWETTGKKLVYFYGPDNILLELAEYPPPA